MKHHGLKLGSVSIYGGKKASTVADKPVEKAKQPKFEARPFVSSFVKKEVNHLDLADNLEEIIDDSYNNLEGVTDSKEIDIVIATIASGLKDMYLKMVNKDNQYTAESLFNIELVSQAFMAIGHVVKIIIYRRSLASRYNNMLRTNMKFAFSAVNMEGSAEELSFATVIDHLIDKFVPEDASK